MEQIQEAIRERAMQYADGAFAEHEEEISAAFDCSLACRQEAASEGIGNKGVSEIKLFDKEDSGANRNRGEEKSKVIGIRELLKHMYT